MKKLFYFVLAIAAQTVSAQQLANSTFDADWVECHPWEKGEYSDTPKGTQPEGWCISNVPSVKVSVLSFDVPLVGEVETPGANGSAKAVKLSNVSTSGQNIPGYMSLGTTWATAEVKGITQDVQNADGGVFGGMPFTYHPDAVRLTYKCDRSGGEENMSIVAYLWKGHWTQTNVPSNTAVKVTSYGTATKVEEMIDRIHNILGKPTATGDTPPTHTPDAALIAKVEYYSNAAQNTWKTQEFALDYGDFAGQPVNVEMLNIVVSANGLFDNRNLIKSGNSITIDDVELVYWHALSALSYEGATLSFTENTTNYDLSSVEYDETKLSYTIKGQAATATKTYNEETAVLTIRVEGEDFASNSNSYTEYTIQFKVPEVGPQVVSSKTYSEDLYVSFAGETADKQVANVLVETLDNGNINFVLKNFVLGEGEEDPICVGNIAVSDIVVAADGNFTFNDDIEIVDGDDPAYEGQWAASMINTMCGGSVPLNLQGRFIGEDHLVVTITIDITGLYVVEVHLGYARATMAVNAEAKYGTFCAPYAVEVPASVQAYTVPSVAANGKLTLTEVANTIPANTPVVLYAGAGLETVESFGIAEAGTPVAGLLTGVFENAAAPVGSYVLQNLDEKVGFYKVVAGSQPTVGVNRCYLTVASSIKAFFFDDEATGINDLNANVNETIYNLAGQRLNKVQKGINIINGKKILK